MPICCLESTQGGAAERREEMSDRIGFVLHWRSKQSHLYFGLKLYSQLLICIFKPTSERNFQSGPQRVSGENLPIFFTNTLIVNL